jgi:hypothetical protein
MIEEIVPGVVQWDAFRETISRRVHSTFVLSSGTLIDPMEPDGDDGLDAFAELATPRRIVLSNRLHYRDSALYAKRFGCPVLCHEAGLSHFADERPVRACRACAERWSRPPGRLPGRRSLEQPSKKERERWPARLDSSEKRPTRRQRKLRGSVA